MRIVCISDTHGLARGVDIPDGDLLLHAGDLTGRGRPTEIAAEADWLRSLPHRRKVVIAGNHDFGLETDAVRCRPLLRGLVYLEDAEAEFEGMRIWGSPWQPRFFDWAFNLDRGPAIRAKWDLIPAGIDILVTHGPPARILDRTAGEQDAGCADLREAVRRVRPRLHLFGHIHEGYGRLEEDGTTFVNASLCDLAYEPVNPPIVVDL